MKSACSQRLHNIRQSLNRCLRPNRFVTLALSCCCILLLTVACISYRFTGTNINYDLIKTIQIDRMPNRAPYGWAPMEAMFNNKLQDIYANQTRLTIVK